MQSWIPAVLDILNTLTLAVLQLLDLLCRSPDTPRPRQAVATTASSTLSKSPVKEPREAGSKERVRSNSVTSPAPAPSNRKRTSSGVFQVDETEPPPKKPELARSTSETSRKRPEVNGKKEPSENDAKKGKQEKKVIERFDEEAKSKCVSAFKESDSWD